MLKKYGIFISFLGILFCPGHKARQLLAREELTSDNLRNVHAFPEFGERVRVQRFSFTETPLPYRTDKADAHFTHIQNVADSHPPSGEIITNSPEVAVVLPDSGNDRNVNTNVLNSSENEESYYLNSSYTRENNNLNNKIKSELEEKPLLAGTPIFKHFIQNSSHVRIVGDTNPPLTGERYCEEIEENGVLWNSTEGGVVVLTSCPDEYIGSAYRTCYANGQWGHIHFFDCRFRKLLELKTLLDYHLVRRLWDGLHYVMEELISMLGSHKIYSVMDRLDAMCMVSDVLRAKTDLILNNCLDVAYIKVVLSNVEKLLTYEEPSLSANSNTHDLLKVKAINLVQSLAKFAREILKAYVSSFGHHVITSPTSVIELIVASRDDNPSGLEYSSVLEEKIFIPRLQGKFQPFKVCVITVKKAGMFLLQEKVLMKSDLIITELALSENNKGEHLKLEYDVHFQIQKPTVPKGYALACSSISNLTDEWLTGTCWMREQEGPNITCTCYQGSILAVIARKLLFVGSWNKVQKVGPAVMTGCIVCLVAVILTFGTTPFHFRNERPGLPTIIVNILIAVAANQIIILFGVTATDDEVLCSSVALLLHYVHLVGSLWLICYVVHIYRQLWQLSERPWTILGYCLVSWLLPAGFVVSSYLVNPKGYETNQYCWLTIQGGMGISFVLPMVFLLLLNTVFVLASMKRFFALRSVTPKNEIDRTRFSLRTGMVILPYFFVNWFFSVLAFEDVFTTMFHYIFALTNSLQGILIFLFFCALNPKVQRACRETSRTRGRTRRVSSVRMKRRPFSTRHERESCRYNDSYPLLPDSSNEIHSIL